MITIDKTVKITIDGSDVQALSNVCELARQRITAGKPEGFIGGFDAKQIQEIQDFLNKMFSI